MWQGSNVSPSSVVACPLPTGRLRGVGACRMGARAAAPDGAPGRCQTPPPRRLTSGLWCPDLFTWRSGAGAPPCCRLLSPPLPRVRVLRTGVETPIVGGPPSGSSKPPYSSAKRGNALHADPCLTSFFCDCDWLLGLGTTEKEWETTAEDQERRDPGRWRGREKPTSVSVVPRLPPGR